MRLLFPALTLAAFVLALPARSETVANAGDFEAPFQAQSEGKPIFLQDCMGHAAPLVVDWDGDGLQDLLVGQFAAGLTRIYRNAGRKGAPVLGTVDWFMVGTARASVEAG